MKQIQISWEIDESKKQINIYREEVEVKGAERKEIMESNYYAQMHLSNFLQRKENYKKYRIVEIKGGKNHDSQRVNEIS